MNKIPWYMPFLYGCISLQPAQTFNPSPSTRALQDDTTSPLPSTRALQSDTTDSLMLPCIHVLRVSQFAFPCHGSVNYETRPKDMAPPAGGYT